MKRSAFTLVEIMILVAIVALLAALAIPNLLSGNNTVAARANILNLSKACEKYAAANNGLYPDTVAKLDAFMTSAGSYCADAAGGISVVQGYKYRCTLGSGGYTLIASPVTSGVTGTVTYTATTGGALTPN